MLTPPPTETSTGLRVGEEFGLVSWLSRNFHRRSEVNSNLIKNGQRKCFVGPKLTKWINDLTLGLNSGLCPLSFTTQRKLIKVNNRVLAKPRLRRRKKQ